MVGYYYYYYYHYFYYYDDDDDDDDDCGDACGDEIDNSETNTNFIEF